MNKQLILDRLRATIDMLKGLDDNEFNYINWVSRGDYENVCGTVCCVAGWYPKYFPEAGLEWVRGSENNMAKIDLEGKHILSVTTNLALYHGLNDPAISALFLGFRLGDDLDDFALSSMPLPMVIERFEMGYGYVNAGQWDKYLLTINETV